MEGYPVKTVFYMTKLYLSQPNMITDRTKNRFLRLRFYITISEFERICSYLGPGPETFEYAFPWPKKGDDTKSALGPLPALEESLKLYEEELGKLEIS